MLEQLRAQWRFIVTAIMLVGTAAGALAAGVSVLAQGHGEESTRRPVVAPVGGTPAASIAQDAAGQASPGVAQPQGQPTPRPPMGATYHTVESGETLGMIAAEYGLTTVAIANANGLANPNLIRVGQRLIIPAR
jgi:nucleoid-associated protein YgaU